MERIYDIAIVGAGPAGAAAAMSLLARSGSRFRMAVIDKASFPREKVCGDAIPYWVFHELEKVCPGIHQRMLTEIQPLASETTRVITKNKKYLDIRWSKPGYMIQRSVLDHFLLSELKKMGDFDLLESTQVSRITRQDGHFVLLDKNGQAFLRARFLIGADGAPSSVSRSLQPILKKSRFSGSAVRGYFTDLQVKDPKTAVICLSRKHAPGYFWFFPLGPDRANVGFGMLNAKRQSKRLNLHDAFWQIAEDHPEICRMLNSSHLDELIKGGILPFGRHTRQVSGPGFCLTGDAAYLLDPLTGDGIRNAVISGILAGEALALLPQDTALNDCQLRAYDQSLKRRFARSFRQKSHLIRLVSWFPWLVNLSTWSTSRILIKWAMRWI